MNCLCENSVLFLFSLPCWFHAFMNLRRWREKKQHNICGIKSRRLNLPKEAFFAPYTIHICCCKHLATFRYILYTCGLDDRQMAATFLFIAHIKPARQSYMYANEWYAQQSVTKCQIFNQFADLFVNHFKWLNWKVKSQIALHAFTCFFLLCSESKKKHVKASKSGFYANMSKLE